MSKKRKVSGDTEAPPHIRVCVRFRPMWRCMFRNISAYSSASQENLDRADRAGVLDFIGKPFEPTDLVGTINHVLELTERAAVGDVS